MRIIASFFGPIRRPWREQTRELEVSPGTSIGGLLGSLGYSEEEMRSVAVVINGRRRQMSFELSDSDDVRFMLLAGGG